MVRHAVLRAASLGGLVDRVFIGINPLEDAHLLVWEAHTAILSVLESRFESRFDESSTARSDRHLKMQCWTNSIENEPMVCKGYLKRFVVYKATCRSKAEIAPAGGLEVDAYIFASITKELIVAALAHGSVII